MNIVILFILKCRNSINLYVDLNFTKHAVHHQELQSAKARTSLAYL